MDLPSPTICQTFHELARQKESTILEGHIMPDHIHMLIMIPPKYAVAAVIGFLKGKCAIAVARKFSGNDPPPEIRTAILDGISRLESAAYEKVQSRSGSPGAGH